MVIKFSKKNMGRSVPVLLNQSLCLNAVIPNIFGLMVIKREDSIRQRCVSGKLKNSKTETTILLLWEKKGEGNAKNFRPEAHQFTYYF